jgi:tetratricopeptide (TPR) repeat protein
MKSTKRIAASLAAAFLASGYLFAGVQCRLKGIVTDGAGAPVEGAAIIITTPGMTNLKVTLKTDKKGEYLTLLNDCTMAYHVRAEKEGFTASEADKKIPVGDIASVDLKITSAEQAAAKANPAAGAAAKQPSASDQAAMTFNAGVEALNAGDKATAEKKFLEAVGKNPDLPAGWNALATMAYEKKDWAKSIEYGQKATDLDPSLTNLYGMMADASRQSGDKKGAAEWQAKYNEANPDSPEILYNKGVEAYNKGKMKDAEAALIKVVEAKPDNANAHYLLGMASFNLNKKAAAKEHFEKYLELDPNGKDAATVKELLPLLK